MKINTISISYFITPIFVGVLPLIFLFKENPGEVWASDFFLASFFMGLLALIFLSIFYFLSKNLLKSCVSASIALLPLFLVNESSSLWLNISVWIGLLLLGIIVSLTPLNFRFFSVTQKILLLSTFVLAIFNGISITFSKINTTNKLNQIDKDLNAKFSDLKLNKSLTNNNFNSDIYFIVLDEYISPVAFKDYYKYDNTSFFKFLEESNFHLGRYTYSNYPWTIPSVSSMVTMNYHENWVTKAEFPQVAHHLIRYNLIAKLLSEEGYATYSLPSIYWLGNQDKGIWKDFLFRAKSYGFMMSLMRSTPFAEYARGYQRTCHASFILDQLNQLSEIAKKKGPKKFVFAHFLCPHRPIVFTKEGRALSSENIVKAEKDSQHLFYLEQAAFISSAIQKVIKDIFDSSSSPPVIVLVSDHGKFPIGTSGKGKATLPLKDLSWRLSNLAALHLPGFDQKMPDMITPVNIFRLILSNYFGYKLDPLEDQVHPHFFDFESGIPAKSLILFQYENGKFT